MKKWGRKANDAVMANGVTALAARRVDGSFDDRGRGRAQQLSPMEARGERLCLVCFGIERPGELRHSYVHLNERHLDNVRRPTSAATGPAYRPFSDNYGPTPGNQRRPHRRRPSGRSVATKVASAVAGAALVGGAAYGVTNWVVGLNSGSAAQSQAATVNNITIAAVSSPSASNLLYPGANGDVVLTITNSNVFPVTITGVDLPTSSTFATGYSASNLTGAISGCSSSTSDVLWNFSTATSGSVHGLTTALTVGASSSLTVTMTNDASMATAAPAACEAAYFSMPSLTGVVATGGAATATTSPATDSWTS